MPASVAQSSAEDSTLAATTSAVALAASASGSSGSAGSASESSALAAQSIDETSQSAAESVAVTSSSAVSSATQEPKKKKRVRQLNRVLPRVAAVVSGRCRTWGDFNSFTFRCLATGTTGPRSRQGGSQRNAHSISFRRKGMLGQWRTCPCARA